MASLKVQKIDEERLWAKGTAIKTHLKPFISQGSISQISNNQSVLVKPLYKTSR